MSLEALSPWVTLWIGVLGTGGASALISGWYVRRKVGGEAKKLEAEAEVTVAQMAMEIANTMRAVSTALEIENDRLRTDLNALRERVIALETAHAMEVRRLQDERDKALGRVATLERTENEQAARIAALEDKERSMSAKIRDLEAKVKRLQNGA